MDDARALLNSLMGNDRNARPEQRKIRRFTDDDICRNYNLGLCPHDLFRNTKIDLGVCEKEHNEFLKEEFEEDPDIEKYKRKWRGPLRTQLRRLLEGVDRRSGSNQLRIAREKEGGPAGASEEQKLHLATLKEEVSIKLKSAEQAADDGKFEDSRSIMKDTEALKRRIEDLETKRYEKYSKDSICDVCGLIIDSQEVEDMKTGRGWHINGKQHIGYTLIREKLKELEEESARDRANGLRTPTPSPEKERPRKPEAKRRKSPSRSKGRSDARRRKSKSRSPSRRKRKSSRSRSRRRKSSRSRSRSRRKKSRSRKRSRSRSRDKQKTKASKDASPKRRNSPLNGVKGKEKEKEKDKDKDKDKDKEKDKDKKKKKSGKAEEDDKDKKLKKSVAVETNEGPAPLAAPPVATPPVLEEPVPDPPPEPPQTEGEKDQTLEEQGARFRPKPVFMVFRRPGQ